MSNLTVVRKASDQVIRAAQAPQNAPRDLNHTLETVAGILDNSKDVVDSVREIFIVAANAYIVAKQLDALTEQILAQGRGSLEKLRLIGPTVEKQLEALSRRVDATLDRALAIDPSACSEVELEHRGQLLRLAEQQSRMSHELLMKLMAI